MNLKGVSQNEFSSIFCFLLHSGTQKFCNLYQISRSIHQEEFHELRYFGNRIKAGHGQNRPIGRLLNTHNHSRIRLDSFFQDFFLHRAGSLHHRHVYLFFSAADASRIKIVNSESPFGFNRAFLNISDS